MSKTEGVELDEALQQIQKQKGVQGTVAINNDGSVFKCTFEDKEMALEKILDMKNVADAAVRVVKTLDPTNKLMFIRIGTTKEEIIMAVNKEFLMMTVQETIEEIS